MRVNLYAQNANTAIVAGTQLSGFAEGDFMDITFEGNAAQRTKGADGPSMNISTSQGGKASISLMPNSPALGQMLEIRNLQAVNPQMFQITILSGVQELITLSGCAFAELPGFTTGGEKMSERKFDFEFLKGEPDTSGVQSITGGAVAGLI